MPPCTFNKLVYFNITNIHSNVSVYIYSHIFVLNMRKPPVVLSLSSWERASLLILNSDILRYIYDYEKINSIYTSIVFLKCQIDKVQTRLTYDDIHWWSNIGSCINLVSKKNSDEYFCFVLILFILIQAV